MEERESAGRTAVSDRLESVSKLPGSARGSLHLGGGSPPCQHSLVVGLGPLLLHSAEILLEMEGSLTSQQVLNDPISAGGGLPSVIPPHRLLTWWFPGDSYLHLHEMLRPPWLFPLFHPQENTAQLGDDKYKICTPQDLTRRVILGRN